MIFFNGAIVIFLHRKQEIWGSNPGPAKIFSLEILMVSSI